MRKSAIRVILFGVVGVTLGAVGVTFMTWSFWILLITISAIVINEQEE